MKDIFTYLKNDKNFVNSMNNNSKENIVTKIDNILNNLEKLNEEDIPIEIKIDFYLKRFTNELVKLEIKNNISSEEVFNFNMIENNINMSIKNENNVLNFKYSKNDNNNIIELFNQEITMKINYIIDTKYNKTIRNKDISKSVEINKLTEQEQTEISNKLMAHEGMTEFINDLSIYMNTLFSYPTKNENYSDNNLNDNDNNDTNNIPENNIQIEEYKLK